MATYTCVSGSCAIGSCVANRYDVNGTYSDGCECAEDGYAGNGSCAAASNLGSVSIGTSLSVSGRIIPGGPTADWFRVDFPASGRPGGGTPRIRLDSASASNFVLRVMLSSCSGSNGTCGSEGGSAAAVSDYRFTDSVAGSGYRLNSTPWPSTVYFRVTRLSGAPTPTSCTATGYTVLITR